MRDPSPVSANVDIASAAQLFGDSARALMLDALMDGEAHSAGELAARARIAASTCSGHLRRLSDGGLVLCETSGRRRLYRLASADVAEALEALGRLARPSALRSLAAANRNEALGTARTCYDHLAGRFGVAVTDALLRRGALVLEDGSFRVSARGCTMLEELGVDVAAARGQRRAFARSCIDWSERRPHLAGSLGAAMLAAFLEHGWVRRCATDRALAVTAHGRAQGLIHLGLEWS
jgi:DNA-binding transcriptional ArsR family regulator